MLDYDSELQQHQRALQRSLTLRPDDHVLDIGCGAGQSTREAARKASDGRAVGIDTARQALQTARQLAHGEPQRNVEFVCGDGAALPFRQASFDVVISRFGTMFFADPAAAFANIAEVLRPNGQLVMMVWQAAEQNEWTVAIHRALVDDDLAMPESTPGQPAFSLSDPVRTHFLLRSANFDDIVFESVHARVFYGRDSDSALHFVKAFSNVASALDAQPPQERERTVIRLRNTLAEHHEHDGVWFDSRAWIVTARRA